MVTHSRTHGLSLLILLFSAGSYLNISSCALSSLMSLARLNVLRAMLDPEPDAMVAAAKSSATRPHTASSLRVYSRGKTLPHQGAVVSSSLRHARRCACPFTV